MVAVPNHTGKLPFMDVQDAAAHTEIPAASHKTVGNIAEISTK
ncbi:MAG: hypothetical protein ACREP4_14555 [Stenotrophomonas sp.]